MNDLIGKSHKRLPGRAKAEQAEHFGVVVRAGQKYGLRIDRATYAPINKRSSITLPREYDPELWDSVADQFDDDEHRFYTDEHCALLQRNALHNFDLSMAYFNQLDPTEFDSAVARAVTSQKNMVEVTDLNEWDGKRGLYVMVLDQYRQAYIGVTESAKGIKGRIRQHWSKNKELDRLVMGDPETSIMSIDSFRALDTSRIFAALARNPFSLETQIVEAFPRKFLLNRIVGGRGDLVGIAAALGADVTKHRPLTAEN